MAVCALTAIHRLRPPVGAGRGRWFAGIPAHGQAAREQNRHERCQYSQSLAHWCLQLTPYCVARQETTPEAIRARPHLRSGIEWTNTVIRTMNIRPHAWRSRLLIPLFSCGLALVAVILLLTGRLGRITSVSPSPRPRL